MLGVQVRKDQALYAVSRCLSQRRACTLLSVSRTSLVYVILGVLDYGLSGTTGPQKALQKTGKLNTSPAYDFVYDCCANGQKIKCLTVIDEYTRECLAIDVNSAIRSSRVIEILSALIRVHGAPSYLRSDNGPEFVSHVLLNWVRDEGLNLALWRKMNVYRWNGLGHILVSITKPLMNSNGHWVKY